jgi:DNA transposition AAA+ family ATPase
MQPAIVRFLRGKQALIIIDEAQHLSSQALDQLRSIHDLAKTGIVLSGNETVYGQLEGGSRRAQYAQLFSRVGMRMKQNTPRAKDICDIIKGWAVDDPECIRLLKAIGRKPGALRTLTKVIRLSFLLAAGDEQSLGAPHIRRAYAQLSSETMEA